mgnify:CR=1 FL=1|tara:strand:+ start:411 stop:662 length:252 start_codon:yes stop_codon:yes gene_type:complete
MTRGLYGSAGFGLTMRDNPVAYRKAYYQKNKAKISARNLKKYHEKSEECKAVRREAYRAKKDYVKSLEKEIYSLKELLKNNND